MALFIIVSVEMGNKKKRESAIFRFFMAEAFSRFSAPFRHESTIIFIVYFGPITVNANHFQFVAGKQKNRSYDAEICYISTNEVQ